MTIEERFERIEHWTAGLAEERRKDREEFRALWRDTQRQINELSTRMLDFEESMERLGRETRERDERLAAESRERDNQLREDFRKADAALGERIAALVSAIGDYLAKLPPREK